MKSKTITGGRILFAICIIALTLALVSWDRKQSNGRFYQKQLSKSVGQTQDTIPSNKDKKIRDLDQAIAELEAIDIKVELEKALEEVNQAIKELDVQKIQLDVQKSMKEVDFDQIKAEVDMAMKEVNMQKLQLDVQQSLKEIDFAKIEREVKESVAKIDWDKMKAGLDEVKKIDLSEMEAELSKVKDEMKKIGPEIEKELTKAKVEIDKAKVEMKEYKSFIDGLEKDGLMNKKETYSITYKDGKLTINGKEVSDKTYEKYRNFLDKHKKFNIEKAKDDFQIDMD